VDTSELKKMTRKNPFTHASGCNIESDSVNSPMQVRGLCSGPAAHGCGLLQVMAQKWKGAASTNCQTDRERAAANCHTCFTPTELWAGSYNLPHDPAKTRNNFKKHISREGNAHVT